MAKCGVTNVAGGGGIGSDELSVTKKQVKKGMTYVGADTNDEIGVGELDLEVITAVSPDVLEGKVTVDKEGNPLPGTMPNLTDRSTIEHASNNATKVLVGDAVYVSKNTDNVTRAEIRYNGDAGYVRPNTLFAIDQAKMATSLGIEPWKMRGDVNVCGVQGGIPIQGADAGNDWAWNTAWSNFGDGNIFMGVRNGHYLNGVNWIKAHIPNFVAGNIKKGVNIGGVVGTFEGWVPTANDLYVRGNNIAGFTSSSKNNFESGGIRIIKSDKTYIRIVSAGNIDYTKYNYINIEGYYEAQVQGLPQQRNLTFDFEILDAQSSNAVIAVGKGDMPGNYTNFTRSVYIGPVSISRRTTITLGIAGEYYYDGNDGRYWDTFNHNAWSGYVYRIWLS